MATTSAELAAVVLDSFEFTGVEFALLHGEAAIAAGEVTSDLDVVVGTHPLDVLERLSEYLEPVGLRAIMIWNYDVGDTATVFLSTGDASQAVQLDLMYDPHGIGKYGAKTGPMLASRVVGRQWPAVESSHRVAYLIRKRHVKQDSVRLEALLSEARRFASVELIDVVNATFSPRVATSILDLVAGRITMGRVPFPRGYRVRDIRRRVDRLISPAGFWVDIVGESAAEAAPLVARRFARFLPIVKASSRPPGGLAQIGWLRSTLGPVRWRAGLLVSSGSNRRWPRSDLELQADAIQVLCESVVDAMHRRLIK